MACSAYGGTVKPEKHSLARRPKKSGVAMANSRSVVLKLYKTMLREALEFDSYNFRMYALRRIRDGFRENMNISDKAEISEMISYAKENLDIIKRQTTIGKLYSTEKLIMENSEHRENKLSSEKVIA